MSDFDSLVRIREICMALPEATEKPFGGHTAPSFRVRDKLFAMTSEDGLTLTFKAGPGVQDALVSEAPERFFVPKYVGVKGWIGARLDVDHDWDEMAELIEDSYRLIAPKRLSNLLDNEASPSPAAPGSPRRRS
ncbi:MmcQ/YjbR family DNA-binding protein [Actinomadura luteofluorescens]|uniref:MmcQ/YjbR family DNA-binding protein n=1 Tax=Actinomadura luteofluorescens TaxID=46163 RepID=UPI00348E5557